MSALLHSKINHLKKTLLCLSLSLLLTFVIERGEASGMSFEEIFHWVACELEIDKDYPMPQIKVVSKQELQRVFKQESERSYQRWIRRYGENEAKKAMDLYLKEVIGLFVPKLKVIYVGSFMEPCKFNSILAHEITHYFQVMEDGPVDSRSIGFESIHFVREMQANKIANKYIETFCNQHLVTSYIFMTNGSIHP